MLDQFISAVKGGMARTNRFKVRLTMPKCMINGYAKPPQSVDMRKVELFCDQVQLPGVNFSTIQNRTFGEFRETPYEKLYDAVNMSFYVDKDLMVKTFFDTWMSGIQDKTRRTFNYYDQYITDIELQVMDTVDKTVYIVNLHEAYPKTVGSIQLDLASKDIMKLNVSFQYKYFRAYKTTYNEVRDPLDTTTPTLPDSVTQGIITNPFNIPALPGVPGISNV